MTQLNTKKFKINFVIHIDSLFMILCPYDFISYVECTNKISGTPDQAPTFAKLEMISLPSTLA